MLPVTCAVAAVRAVQLQVYVRLLQNCVRNLVRVALRYCSSRARGFLSFQSSNSALSLASHLHCVLAWLTFAACVPQD